MVGWKMRRRMHDPVSANRLLVGEDELYIKFESFVYCIFVTSISAEWCRKPPIWSYNRPPDKK
jgi:hypothetical protein